GLVLACGSVWISSMATGAPAEPRGLIVLLCVLAIPTWIVLAVLDPRRMAFRQLMIWIPAIVAVVGVFVTTAYAQSPDPGLLFFALIGPVALLCFITFVASVVALYYRPGEGARRSPSKADFE